MPLMSKEEENKKGASIRQAEEEYCHQCQRGRLLEMLSFMAKVSREEQRKSPFTKSSRGRGRAAEAEAEAANTEELET